MDKTIIVNRPLPARGGLRLGLLWFVVYFSVTLVLISWLNNATVNRVMMPVLADADMFQLIWQNNPLDALRFIANKSLFAPAHYDARSGLNLWTLEIDSITLLGSLLVCLFCGYLMVRARVNRVRLQGWGLSFAGLLCVLLALTYMTHIAHCAGPTWVGYVIAYGLEVENVDINYYWPLGLGCLGLLLLVRAFIVTRRD